MTRFLPPTKAVTSKFSGMRSGPTTAWVRPVPALDFEGQAEGPLAWILLSLQVVRPLPEILTVFGKSISIFEALVPSMLFLTNVVTLMDFGFFFVPDFVGETVVVAVTSPLWATATVAMARAASAAITAMRYLRKKSLLLRRDVCSGQGEAPDHRSLSAAKRPRYRPKVSLATVAPP